MIILLMLIILYFILIGVYIKNAKHRDSFILWSLFMVFAYLILLIVFQCDLKINDYPDGVFGSDAAYYYKQSINLLESSDLMKDVISINNQNGYTCWSALILATSFSRDVVWIKLCNILLFMHILLSLYIILKKANFPEKYCYLALLLIAGNGAIAWTVIRNLKDILIVFLIIESILIIDKLFAYEY